MLEYNEHGVIGNYRYSQFVPLCCSKCQHMDWDSYNDGWTSYTYCTKNVWLPVRKGTCNKFFGDEQYNTAANKDNHLNEKRKV